MSSLRNSLHRRNHKERSQLTHRSRLGLLEKHKDYVLRARDYHSKQDRIQRLRQKAADRNKDEFYFSMVKEKTRGGIHLKDRGNVALPTDMVKVLKTQDENYIRTMRATGLKKIDRIKEQLLQSDLFGTGLDEGGQEALEQLDDEEIETLKRAGILDKTRKLRSNKNPKNHLVFVADEEEARQRYSSRLGKNGQSSKTEDQSSDDVEDLGWKVESEQQKRKRRRHSTIQDEEDLIEEREIVEEEKRTVGAKHRTRLLKELSARLNRDVQLRYAERELEMQRLMMGKGAHRKIHTPEKAGEGSEEDEDELDDPRSRGKSRKEEEKTYTPRVYKWRAERKR